VVLFIHCFAGLFAEKDYLSFHCHSCHSFEQQDTKVFYYPAPIVETTPLTQE